MNEYRSKNKYLKHLDFILADLVILEGSYLLSWLIRFRIRGAALGKIPGMYRHEALILLFGLLLSLVIGDPYKDVLRRSFGEEFGRLVRHTLNMLIVDILALFFIHEAGSMSRWLIVETWVFYFIGELIFRHFWKKHLTRRFRTRGGSRSMIVFTSGAHAAPLLKNLGRETLRDYFIPAAFCADYETFFAKARKAEARGALPEGISFSGEGDLVVCGIPVLGGRTQLIDYASHNWVDEVLLDTRGQRELQSDLEDICGEMNVPAMCILTHIRGEGMDGEPQKVERLADYIVTSRVTREVPLAQWVLKRLLDIVGSLIGCAVTCVLAVFVGPAIYISSPGPIIFKQTRVGRNGKTFQMYKFRSMYPDAEERKAELYGDNKVADGYMFKLDDDPRIIGSGKKDKNGRPKGIGNFIRRTSIDEFPQFFNVLKGDMSLVGTRPPTEDEWERYSPRHRARLGMRPGITGLWQVSGRSGIVDFDKVVELDTEYIRTWTVGMDLKILAKTVGVVLTRKGAE